MSRNLDVAVSNGAADTKAFASLVTVGDPSGASHRKLGQGVLLTEFLAQADPPLRYRIDGLWPIGGNIVIPAQFKAGKSTLAHRLVRALGDGTDFLNAFAVHPHGRRIALIDNELDRDMLRYLLRRVGMVNTDRVVVHSLRGRLSEFDIRRPDIAAAWVESFRDDDVGTVVLDCLRPVLDMMGLSEDKDAGVFLVHMDQLTARGGATESAVVHHMGHGSDRGRGDSRLRDWPDAEWKVTRPPTSEGEDNPRAPRYFSAYGRGVDVPEKLLSLDETTGVLTYTDTGRAAARNASAVGLIVDLIAANDAAGVRTTKSMIETGIGGRAQYVRQAISAGEQSGRLIVEQAPRGRPQYVTAPTSSTSSRPRPPNPDDVPATP